jgi:hypothetical protein
MTVCSEDSLILVDRKHQSSANRERRRDGENPLAAEALSEQTLFDGAR